MIIKRDGRISKMERITQNTLSIEVTFKDGYMIFKTESNEFRIDDNIEIIIEKTNE